MDARIQPLPLDPATLRGLSLRLIESHQRNNDGGAVKRLNAIRAQLRATAFGTAPGFQLDGLKREELIATKSMLLHEFMANIDWAGVHARLPGRRARRERTVRSVTGGGARSPRAAVPKGALRPARRDRA